MKKKYLFYTVMICVNLIPSIPLSNKGILGLLFILIISAKSNLKGTMFTAITLILLGFFSFLMDFSVDYEHGLFTLFLGSILYLCTAYFAGSHTEKNRNMIQDLKMENQARKELETELKQTIAMQDSFMNTIPTPLYFKDLMFKYKGFNPAFLEFIEERQHEKVIGMDVFQLFDKNIAELCNQMDVDLVNQGEKQVQEISVCSEKGDMKHLINYKALIQDADGNPSGIVGVILDITEQKESEKLRTNIVRMQMEDQLKTEFFSNISHELRTPLNVIFSAVQLIEMSFGTSNQNNQKIIKKNVSSIHQNCLRLQRLVNNLIDINKIDAGAFELRLENLDLVHIVEEITLSVADYVSNKGISLVFDTNIEEKVMAFDEEKMERIILNLLSNAIKYTPEGGTINVTIIDKNDHIVIQIEDSGAGIPQDKLNFIFDRFYQICPIHTRIHEGSGIGLNLVKSLVTMLHGEISVKSVLEQGTVFEISLPCSVIKGENRATKPMIFDQHARIEKIQLEFSDIYKLH